MSNFIALNTQISNQIEHKTQVFIKFAGGEYKQFNLYNQDKFYIERLELNEEQEIVMSDDEKSAQYKTKFVERKISSKITDVQYNEILELNDAGQRKFNTDRLEFSTNLTLRSFISKYFN